MAIRISQHQIYSHAVNGMNQSLSELMALHNQNVTQKKVNRPADDPYGSSQIMNAKNTLAAITQYSDNLDMAKAWLDQTDGVLSLVDTELVELQTILMQGATGTLNKDQRQNLAFKAREILNQLINYSNTELNNRSIFAGHKTDGNAFELALGVTCNDDNMSDVQYKVIGGSASTVIVQFSYDPSEADAVGNPKYPSYSLTTKTVSINEHPTFRYSPDAGETWKFGEWDTTNNIMHAGSVDIAVIPGSRGLVSSVAPYSPSTGKDDPTVGPDNPHENNNGTWLYIRPTAVYLGDTNDTKVVQTYPLGSSVQGTVQGTFTRDVAVRIDNITPVPPPTNARIEYSYSLDNGDNWISANAPFISGASKLAVPGGILTLDAADPVLIGQYDEYIIKPYRADIELNVGFDSSIVINNVGRDVFGGIYEAPFDRFEYPAGSGVYQSVGAQPANGYGKNIFEVVGNAIAYFESNGQQGCQEILDELDHTMEYVVGYRTKTGARMNRVESVENQLEYLKYDEEGRLSTLEDVDVSELLSKLSQQQLAYNSILKSSSMIMQMSLLNFI